MRRVLFTSNIEWLLRVHALGLDISLSPIVPLTSLTTLINKMGIRSSEGHHMD